MAGTIKLVVLLTQTYPLIRQKAIIINQAITFARSVLMKAFKFVRDPNAFELMADETRRRVIYLLRAKEMTVSQIAAELQKTPQAIYHHIRKFLEAGLVEVAKEERVDHFIETYYRASAEVFDFIHGEGGSEKYGEQRTRDALQALGQLGINLQVNEETISKMLRLMKVMNAIALKPDQEEKITALEGVDFIGKQEIAKIVNILTMSDKQFEVWLAHQREFRNLLKSALAQQVQVPIQRAKAR